MIQELSVHCTACQPLDNRLDKVDCLKRLWDILVWYLSHSYGTEKDFNGVIAKEVLVLCQVVRNEVLIVHHWNDAVLKGNKKVSLYRPVGLALASINVAALMRVGPEHDGLAVVVAFGKERLRGVTVCVELLDPGGLTAGDGPVEPELCPAARFTLSRQA